MVSEGDSTNDVEGLDVNYGDENDDHQPTKDCDGGDAATDQESPVAQEGGGDEEEDDCNGGGLQQQSSSRQAYYQRVVVGIILISFIAFIVADSLTNGYVGDGINSFLEWIEDNPGLGIFVFMAVYFVATVLFIPGSVLTLGAGFVFANAFGLGTGVLLGAISVFFGASSGAIAAFFLGRFLLRDWVSRLTKKYAIFEALDLAFEEKGCRIMTLLRLSPIVPFNAINYIAGVTALSTWGYISAMLGILPGTILYVFLGASAGSLADSANSGDNMTITIVVIVVGIVFGLIAVGFTSYYAKQELNKIVARREAEQRVGSTPAGEGSPPDEEAVGGEPSS